jgi:hypothetical protein
MLETRNGKGPEGRAAVQQTVALQPRIFDLHQAADYIGVSYWTMRDLVFAGMVPTVKIPNPRTKDGRVIRRTLIDRNDLDQLVEQNKETAQ